MRWLPALAFLAASAGSAAAQRRPVPAPPTLPPGEWASAGRDPALTRFSPLDQISAATVGSLRPVWTFSTGVLGPHEGNPLVIGSVLYLQTPYPNTVYALDLAKPGAPILWKYSPPGSGRAGPPPPTGCCDTGNRGLAHHPSGKIYAPLLTGELAALDAATGREIWRVRNADPRSGATLAAAPLVAGDLVLVGISGAEYGVRGHLTAYDALSGRLVWRGYSTGPDTEVLVDGPANSAYGSHQGRDLGVSTWGGEGWRQGGGTTSGWISRDPALGLVYYGTDQPAPGNPGIRPGDNKWASSILARELMTGRVRWALQITPHDEWGFGGSNENILVDLELRGAPVKALVHFDRNGFAYTIDRTNGRILLAEKYGPTNWARTVDQGTGVPQRDPGFAAPGATPPVPARPRGAAAPAGPLICPSSLGAKFLQPAAYAPSSQRFFVPLNNLCMTLTIQPVRYEPGKPYSGAQLRFAPGPGGNRGRFIAWDASTGTIAWENREPLPVSGGALATAGGLVFYGTLDGWLKAVDQRDGRELWRFKTPSGIVGNPITFTGPDGKQLIAVLSGGGGWWAQGAGTQLGEPGTLTTPGGVLLVFGL
jgi:PQQ-dependent dehydrogenase (methanol/ethanol family)